MDLPQSIDSRFATHAVNLFISSRVSPSMLIVFRFPLAPAITTRDDFGRRHSLANSLINAAFAFPPSGGAVTAAFKKAPPSPSSKIPSMRLRTAPGATRTRTRTPHGEAENGVKTEFRLEAASDIETGQDLFGKDQEQDEDHRGNINSTQVGQDATDGAKRRLANPMDEITNSPDEPVAGIDDVERDKPTQHRTDDDHPDI
jgi:hypothetical protein